ncbi:unnamed protein product [Periconia digitata]|uniref:NmrA-like domain-containing protein n=1 Tax=Periconia digitata TaxID=1303443 RepID=A0A9W4UI64_9PLEO|nr:unnamed protein product [Periconia digitata]
MTSKLKIAVVGGTGETGASIVNALLDNPEEFEISILVRPASVGKPAVVAYAQRGVAVKTIELSEVTDALT